MSIDLRLLIKNGVHFGHQTSRWSPKMEPYIWGHKNDIHLIDVSKTAHQLEQASKFLEGLAGEGRSILWVGTKKAAHEIIRRTAEDLKLPFVSHRWVGGTFSNYRQVRKAIANMLHFEDILEKSDQQQYKKKELNTLRKRVGRLNNIVGGVRDLAWPVGAVVVVDVKKEHVCVKEAITMGIPVVAIVDTNSDPSNINYVIPGNDDAPRSIEVLIDYLAEAVRRGQAIAALKPKESLPQIETLETTYAFGFEPEEEDEAAKKRNAARRARGGGGGAAGAARPRTGGPARPGGAPGQRPQGPRPAAHGPRPDGTRPEGTAHAAAPRPQGTGPVAPRAEGAQPAAQAAPQVQAPQTHSPEIEAAPVEVETKE